MQSDPFSLFQLWLESILAPFNLQGLAPIIAVIPVLILIYIIYLVVVRAAKISFRKVDASRQATSGVVFTLRLIFFIIALTALLSATSVIQSGTALTISALAGTAIGLAFSKALSNLVSGIYVLGVRPFRVGDYVKIGNDEGLVTEITLNYTRLLQQDYTRIFVPNSKVVENELINYRVRIDDYVEERGIEYVKDRDAEGRLETAMSKLKYLTKGEEVYRYTFDIYTHKDYPLEKVENKFDELCEEWRFKFLEKPEYFFLNNQNFGIVHRFAYITKDPKVILTDGADFQTAIARSLMLLE